MSDLAKRPRTEAVRHDHALRYMVPSRHDAKALPYLVELDAYDGNGQCCCRQFTMRCEPLLRRGFTPQEAVDKRLIKLKEGRHVEDSLRCEHLLTARAQFCDDVIFAIHEKDNPKTRR